MVKKNLIFSGCVVLILMGMLLVLTGCGDKKDSDESDSSKGMSTVDSSRATDYRDIVEEFADAINNHSKIDSFVDKYFDFKALFAMNHISSEYDLKLDDEDKIEKAFIEEYDTIEESEYSNFKKEFKQSLKDWKDREITVMEIGDLEDMEAPDIDGFKHCDVKFQEFEGNEITVEFLFYKNGIVSVNDGAVVEARRPGDEDRNSDVEQVYADGTEAKNAKLGFIGITAPDEIVKEYNAIAGVYVEKLVENKPGSDTVMVGDIITEFNGERVLTAEDLEKLIDKCKEGDDISVRYYSRVDSRYRTSSFTFFDT